LVELTLPPEPSYYVWGTHHPAIDVNDLAIRASGVLWGVGSYDHLLSRLGSDGGVLETGSHDPSFALWGLVEAGCGGPPTPTTVTTWGRVKSMYR
jgi:hypothetical protein